MSLSAAAKFDHFGEPDYEEDLTPEELADYPDDFIRQRGFLKCTSIYQITGILNLFGTSEEYEEGDLYTNGDEPLLLKDIIEILLSIEHQYLQSNTGPILVGSPKFNEAVSAARKLPSIGGLQESVIHILEAQLPNKPAKKSKVSRFVEHLLSM